MRTIITLALALGCVAMFSGCVVALGNRDTGTARPTLGKQLTDLKQARDSGAINEEEYQAARKRLVEGQ